MSHLVGLAAYAACFLLPLTEEPSTAGDGVPADAAAALLDVMVERSVEQRFAFVEHAGPYWTVGRSISSLSRQLGAAASDRCAVLFRVDPTSGSVSPNDIRVGFRVPQTVQVAAPLSVLVLPAGEVAVVQVDTSSTDALAVHHRLVRWVLDHGFTPSGPLMEIHPLPRDGPFAQQADRLTLQLPVLDLSAKPVPPPLIATAERETELVEAPPAGEAPPQVAAVVENPASHEEEVPCAQTYVESPEPTVNDLKAGAMEDSPALVEEEAGGIARSAIAKLIADRDAPAIAVRLVPSRESIAETHRVWLGQVVARLRAAVVGADRVYPGHFADWAPIAAAWRDRFAVEHGGVSLARASVAVDSADPLEQEKAGLLRRVDQLMARVSTRSLDARGVEAELIDLLEALDGIVGRLGE